MGTNNLYLLHFISTALGFGLEIYGFKLISQNQKLAGYFCVTLGLIVLIINVVIILHKIKK